MGTSAVIMIEGNKKVEVYKHFDGYPESTLPWLKEFNKAFAENRGDDPEYKLAQLLRSSARDAEKFDLDPSIYTGWGLGAYDSFDGNYYYLLKKDGSVKVSQDRFY